jgi:hypothetical protein
VRIQIAVLRLLDVKTDILITGNSLDASTFELVIRSFQIHDYGLFG